MRILLSCLQDLRPHPIPAYRFWADYFRNGIAEAGHKCVEIPNVDWAEGATHLDADALQQWLERTWTQGLRFIDEELKRGMKIAMFLSYLYPQQIDSAAIAEIRRRGIPCVNFFCDNIREFKRVPWEYHSFDLHWVPGWEALEMYARSGAKTCFAPMPCWIPDEARVPATGENGQVTFIGSADELRRVLLNKALLMGARVMIGGAGWSKVNNEIIGAKSAAELLKNQIEFVRRRGIPQWFRKTARRLRAPPSPKIPKACILSKIDDTEYVTLTKESTITLGVNRVPSFRRSFRNPLVYSRLRDIEAPMMGACYLTEWTEGLEHLYDLGTEVETYRTAEEMVAKIDLLKADENARHSMRVAGQRRALADHTVGKSIEKIATSLGLC